MKRFLLPAITIAASLVAGTASADVPLFAAKCPTGITADSSRQGPEGGNRVLYFENGKITGYDQSEADGGAKITVTRSGDEQIVTIGGARFEIFDALIFGG